MKKIIIAVTIAFSFYLFVPLAVHVQGLKDAGTILREKTAPKAGVDTQSSLPDIIGTIINVALSLVGLIFLCLMVYAGYLWMTAQGDEGQIDSAKAIIRSSIIGLVVVMSAYALTVLVTGYFDKS